MSFSFDADCLSSVVFHVICRERDRLRHVIYVERETDSTRHRKRQSDVLCRERDRLMSFISSVCLLLCLWSLSLSSALWCMTCRWYSSWVTCAVCLSLPLCGVVCLCIAVSRVSLYRERCLSIRRSNTVPLEYYSSHHSSLQRIVTRPLYRETHARQEYRCRSNSVSLHLLLACSILIASRMYSVSLLLFRVKCVCALLSRVKCDCVQQRL